MAKEQNNITSEWSNVTVPDCGVRDPSLGSRCLQLFITTSTAVYSLGHRLHILTAVPRLSQPSALRGMVKKLSGWVIVINGDGGHG